MLFCENAEYYAKSRFSREKNTKNNDFKRKNHLSKNHKNFAFRSHLYQVQPASVHRESRETERGFDSGTGGNEIGISCEKTRFLREKTRFHAEKTRFLA